MIGYCIICIKGGEEVLHIFSSPEKRQEWADKDDRAHVFYDYVIDHPERHEGLAQ